MANKKFIITAKEKVILVQRRKKRAIIAGTTVHLTAKQVGKELDRILNKTLMRMERQIDLIPENSNLIKSFDQAHLNLLRSRKEFNRLRNLIPKDGNYKNRIALKSKKKDGVKDGKGKKDKKLK